MTLDKQPLDGKPAGGSGKGSSRTLVLVIAAIVLLALGYTVFRTMANPAQQGNQTVTPAK